MSSRLSPIIRQATGASIRWPRRSAATLAFLCALGCGAPALAAKIDGFGSIASNVSNPALVQIDIAYDNPVFLNVARQVQLTPSDLGHSGHKLLSYSGEGQYGRIGVTSHIGDVAPLNPDLSTSVDIFIGFEDTITPTNLNPLAQNFLRLDIGLHGRMTGGGATANGTTIGHLVAANFDLVIEDPQDSNHFSNLAAIGFSWFGPNFFITNTSAGGLHTPRFVPYAGEEPAFTQVLLPGLATYDFGARGYIDVPLDGGLIDEFGDPFLAQGDPFLLSFAASAHSSCGNEIPQCTAITDFGSTALIGNARIVDQNGDLVAGAAFTSESGYDYITPPDSLNGVPAVPEPETWALMLAGLGVLGMLRRRLNRPR